MTTPDQAERIRGHIASLMTAVRPDWDIAGCISALRNVNAAVATVDVAIAALRYAADPANTTPAHLADHGNRAWDRDAQLPCRTHPTGSRRLDGECGGCYADRRAVDTPIPHDRPGVPPPRPLRELLRATAGDATCERSVVEEIPGSV